MANDEATYQRRLQRARTRTGPTEGPDQSWRDAAACQGKPTEWWFPPEGPTGARTPHAERRRNESAEVTEARAICATCPVRPACLEYALSTNQKHGIFGGKDQAQREDIRHQRKVS